MVSPDGSAALWSSLAGSSARKTQDLSSVNLSEAAQAFSVEDNRTRTRPGLVAALGHGRDTLAALVFFEAMCPIPLRHDEGDSGSSDDAEARQNIGTRYCISSLYRTAAQRSNWGLKIGKHAGSVYRAASRWMSSMSSRFSDPAAAGALVSPVGSAIQGSQGEVLSRAKHGSCTCSPRLPSGDRRFTRSFSQIGVFRRTAGAWHRQTHSAYLLECAQRYSVRGGAHRAFAGRMSGSRQCPYRPGRSYALPQ